MYDIQCFFHFVNVVFTAFFTNSSNFQSTFLEPSHIFGNHNEFRTCSNGRCKKALCCFQPAEKFVKSPALVFRDNEESAPEDCEENQQDDRKHGEGWNIHASQVDKEGGEDSKHSNGCQEEG